MSIFSNCFHALFSFCKARFNPKFSQKNDLFREQENLFKQILDTSNVAIFIVNSDGRILHANQRMAEMFLYPKETLLESINYLDLVYPSERAESSLKLNALLSHQTPALDSERIYIRHDGSLFWGHFTGTVFYNTHGEKIGAVATIADIDDRKYAQKNEQHHKHILQMLMHQEPLSSILHVISEELRLLHCEHLDSTISVLDETNQHFYLGATSSRLEKESRSLLQCTNINPSLVKMLIELPPQVYMLNTLKNDDPWSESLQFLDLHPSYYYWISPIYSAFNTFLGFFLLCSFEQPFLSDKELKLIENNSTLVAIAIEKSRNDAKLKLAANVFTHSKEGIIITDPNGTIIEANDAFYHSCGYSTEEIIGKNPRILKSGRQHPSFYKNMWETIFTKGSWRGEIWNRHKNGSIYAEMITISAIKDSQGEVQHFVALFTDISTIKAHEEELEHLAQHDALTALPNRFLLKDRLSQAMAEAKRYQKYLAIVYIDLDGFKAVNDTYGHAMGDELLILVSQRINALIRQNETIARLGGDEFLVLLSNLETFKECEPIVQRFLDALSEPFMIHEISLHISASIGISFYLDDTEEIELLIKKADQAMYHAKQLGKNRYVFFDESMCY